MSTRQCLTRRALAFVTLALLPGLAGAQSNPPVASLAVSRVVATENSTVPVRITVQIDRSVDQDLPILLDLIGGNAVPGQDFLPPNAPPVIRAGSTSASVEFRIRDDDDSEGDERILIAIVPGMGYVRGMPGTLEVLIRDDDASQAVLQQRLQTIIANTPDPLIASQIETLGRLCANGLPPAGSDLAQRCSRLRLALLDPAQARALVDSLRGLVAEELSSQRRGFRMLANGQLGGISKRLETIRFGGGGGFSLSGLMVGDQAMPVDGIGADEDGLLGRGLGVFVSGILGNGERDDTDLETGFTTDTRSLLVGMDKRLGQNWILGAAVMRSRFEADLSLDAGGLDMDLDAVTLYASYGRGQGWIDGSIGAGWGELEQLRNVSFVTTTDEDTVTSVDVLRSTPDTDLRTASLSAGWDWQRGAWRIGPRLAMEYAKLDVERYAERVVSGSNSFAVQIAEQSLRSLTVRAGIGISGIISTQRAVLQPQFELYHVTQLEDDVEDLRGQFINDPQGQIFRIPTGAVDNRNGEFSLGLSAIFPEGRSAFINYRRLFGVDDIEQEFWSLGARFEF